MLYSTIFSYKGVAKCGLNRVLVKAIIYWANQQNSILVDGVTDSIPLAQWADVVCVCVCVCRIIFLMGISPGLISHMCIVMWQAFCLHNVRIIHMLSSFDKTV